MIRLWKWAGLSLGEWFWNSEAAGINQLLTPISLRTALLLYNRQKGRAVFTRNGTPISRTRLNN
jgi:hypothetical protein